MRGAQSRPHVLPPSLPPCAGPRVSLPKAGLICLSLGPSALALLGFLAWNKPGPADGPLLAPRASCSLKELAGEARVCAKPLERGLASVITESDARGKICWKQ